jgi:phosphopantothenoylcysteine decarboxylase/phosphopantothenate--cysteine ligase
MGKILLGICGGIAAYKSAYLASLMKKKSFEVKTIMTEGARKFITPLTFETITCNKVYTGIFESSNWDENHTTLSIWADILVIAPATANTIAKITHGMADNLLTSIVLDFTGPIFIFPAMHENMWNNPATKKNVEELKNRNFYIFDPEAGDLAGGKKGTGRMIEPENILDKVTSVLQKDHPSLLS